MRTYKILVALLAAMVGSAFAIAQNQTMTPYSRYGYGMLNDHATSAQRAMGGVGYAMNNGRQINVMNPASYAAIDSLTFLFDMGGDLTGLFTTEGSKKHKQLSGGFDYLTMQVPLAKWLGASAGILPFSSTGYSFSQSIDNATIDRVGNGNISELYLGLGVKPFNNAFIGANATYMFGSTLNDVYATTTSGSVSLYERYIKVRDINFTFGLQYRINVGTASRITLGLVYTPEKNLHGDTYGIYYASASEVDTVGYTKLNGKYSLPATYGGGLSYAWDDKLIIEGDFTYQPWKNAKFAQIESFEKSEFDNRWKAALGVQYIPSPRGSYAQRIRYRAGLYANHDYLMVRGNNVREYGATIGLGLPIPNFKTMINIGFEYKHRQAYPAALVKEDYINLTVGINFNEVWFRTSKLR